MARKANFTGISQQLCPSMQFGGEAPPLPQIISLKHVRVTTGIAALSKCRGKGWEILKQRIIE